MRVPGTNFEYGRPQFFATLLLLAFLAQASALVVHYPRTINEHHLIREGLLLIAREGNARSLPLAEQYPLTALLAAAPVGLRSKIGCRDSVWLPRIPFLLIAVALGAAIWWIARRLYGNAGGFIALALYCVSPFSVLQGDYRYVGLALGWLSIVFVAIGLAHNLYAPPRHWVFRTVLFVLASAAGVTLHGATAFALPIALLLLLYLAPGRRIAAAMLWSLAAATAVLAWLGTSSLIEIVASIGEPPAVPVPHDFFAPPVSSYWLPLLLGGTGFCFIVFAGWRRTRYFGNWLPLAVIGLLLALTIGRYGAFGPPAFVFAYIFIAGICADLLETRYRRPVLIAIVAFLVLHAATGLYTVFRLLSQT